MRHARGQSEKLKGAGPIKLKKGGGIRIITKTLNVKGFQKFSPKTFDKMQQKYRRFQMSNIYKCFLIFLLILVMGGSLYSTMGEPVPGAEIYIELDPDNEPISNNLTNDFGEVSGFITINPSPVSSPKRVEIKVKIQEFCIRKVKSNLERKYLNLQGTGILGKYEFKMKSEIGSNKAEFKFFIDLRNERDLKALSYKPSGPFSESLSNIEDGKGSSINAPAKIGEIKKPAIKIPFKIRLELTSVNNYGINDEGIK